ncbi:MAG: phytanoyl-CoA dioxygenase family protein [Burkholderiales bacterium]
MAGWTLSEQDKDTYRREGLIVSPHRLPPDRLRAMRESLERLLADNAEVAPESLVCPHIPNGSRHDEAAAKVWFDYATDPLVLDLVAELIGPDIILWGSQVFCKPAFTGRAVPWHQDGQYWPIRPIATCSVWIALDDATPENGCMHYVPGSHRGGRLLEHRRRTGSDIVLNEELSPEAFDFRAARDDRLDAGQFSLHDVLLVHGSNANRSPRRRAGFVIRFMPATSLFDRKVDQRQQQVGVSFSFTRRPIWLVRGVDRAGNDFGAGHGEDYRLVPRRSDDA